MIQQALEYIKNRMSGEDFLQGLAPRKVFIRSGDCYGAHSTVDEYQGECHKFTTLDGLIAYAKNFRGTDAPGLPAKLTDTIMLRVVSPTLVEMVLPVNENRTRPLVAITAPVIPHSSFGNWMEQEEFIIWLQTAFHDAYDRDNLRVSISKVSSESSLALEDDGVSQGVQVRKGVHLTEKGVMNPVVTLLPIRTFHEGHLERVASPFLLRMKKREGEPIKLCLFEADGSAWKVRQMNAIKDYLQASFEPEDNVLVLA